MFCFGNQVELNGSILFLVRLNSSCVWLERYSCPRFSICIDLKANGHGFRTLRFGPDTKHVSTLAPPHKRSTAPLSSSHGSSTAPQAARAELHYTLSSTHWSIERLQALARELCCAPVLPLRSAQWSSSRPHRSSLWSLPLSTTSLSIVGPLPSSTPGCRRSRT